MKKIIKGLAVAGSIATILPFAASCACSAKVIPDFVMPEGGFDTTQRVEISFYHTMGQNLVEVLEAFIGEGSEFQEMYPNIVVKQKSIGNYTDIRDQLTTEIASGSNDANITYCYPDHVARYLKAQSVVTLDKLIYSEYGYSEEQINDFVPAFYNEGKSFGDGNTYCLPFSKSSEVLYYDATFFKKNNLTVPTTWEEMEAVCRQIKKIDPTCIPLGYDSAANWFITMCEQLGSEYTSSEEPHYLFNNPTMRDFAKRVYGWYQESLITTKTLYGSYTSGLFTAAPVGDEPVTRCYMCIGSSAGATYQRPTKQGDQYRFDVGITSIPQIDKAKTGAVISQGPNVTIFRDEDPQKVLASWLLVKYLTTNIGFQGQFSMTSGYTPVIKSVNNNPIYSKFLENADGGDNIAALSTKVCVEQESIYLTSPAFDGSAEARDAVGEMLENIMAAPHGTDIDTYIANKFNEIIDELNY